MWQRLVDMPFSYNSASSYTRLLWLYCSLSQPPISQLSLEKLYYIRIQNPVKLEREFKKRNIEIER